MKKLVLLFAALLVAGCGEKPPSEGSESTGENPTASNESVGPSADTAKPTEDSVTLPLSDADVERLVKEAVELDSFQRRDGLFYQANESEPFSGWIKEMIPSGQVGLLFEVKDGELDGPQMGWHENGQKSMEGTYKDGKPDGLWTGWHENGQKASEGNHKDGKPDGLMTGWHENGQKSMEGTYKDGEEISAKYWNSKGEEVETIEESLK